MAGVLQNPLLSLAVSGDIFIGKGDFLALEIFFSHVAVGAGRRAVNGDGERIHGYSVSLVFMNFLRNTSRGQKIFLVGASGAVLGILLLTAVRFALVRDESTHRHANFGLFINGERDAFKSFTFYEEVASCSGDVAENPKTRAHLHDNTNDVIHIHDGAATWGHFFANLGYTLGNDVLGTDEGVFADDADGKRLTFYLNGQEVDGLANRTINSEDTALISYGDQDEAALQEQFEAITRNAGEYNHRPDPAACSGSKPLIFTERLKKAIGF